MTIYSPAAHQSAIINGVSFEKIWSKDKAVIDLFRAGLISAVIQQTTPGSTAVIWLNPQTAGAGEGTIQIHNGTTWVAATPALLLRHMSEGGASFNGALAMSTNKITGLGNGTAAQDAAAFGQIPVAATVAPVADGTAAIGVSLKFAKEDHVHPTDTTLLAKAGGTMTGAIVLAADPTVALQATTKQYVDALLNGLDWKASVRLATTVDDTLSGLATRDGITPAAGDRVLVKNQTTGSANGIYVASAGAWTRSTDADVSAEVTSALTTSIAEGTINGGVTYKLATADPIVLGTTSLSFVSISAGGTTAASNVTNIPSGNISSTSVQSALNELDTEKLALAGGTMSGAIAMGTSKITGLGNGSAVQDAAAFGQIPVAATVTPLANGTAAVGTSAKFSKEDHVHPTDTTLAPLASPSFTGTPSLPTGTTGITQTAGDSTTKLATTAFVMAAIAITQASAI